MKKIRVLLLLIIVLALCAAVTEAATVSCPTCGKSDSIDVSKWHVSTDTVCGLYCGRCHEHFQTSHDTYCNGKCKNCGYATSIVGTHSASLTGGRAATCSVPGVAAYYKCSACSGTFSDAACKNAIDVSEWEAGAGKIPCLPHTFGSPSYAWNGASCHAERVCTGCTASEDETAQGVFRMTVPATCTEPEKGYYEASFTKECFSAQKTADGSATSGDPLGHKFGTPAYAWNGSACHAAISCTREGCTETVTEDAAGSFVSDTEATCTAPEKGHYEASFTKEYFTAQATEKESAEGGKALGHDFSLTEYTWEGRTCHAVAHCARTGCEAVKKENAKGAFVSDTKATCTEPEKGHYRAEFKKAWFAPAETKPNSATRGKTAEHRFSGWKTVKEPADGKAGLKQRKCEACGFKEQREIPYTAPAAPVTYLSVAAGPVPMTTADRTDETGLKILVVSPETPVSEALTLTLRKADAEALKAEGCGAVALSLEQAELVFPMSAIEAVLANAETFTAVLTENAPAEDIALPEGAEAASAAVLVETEGEGVLVMKEVSPLSDVNHDIRALYAADDATRLLEASYRYDEAAAKGSWSAALEGSGLYLMAECLPA